MNAYNLQLKPNEVYLGDQQSNFHHNIAAAAERCVYLLPMFLVLWLANNLKKI